MEGDGQSGGPAGADTVRRLDGDARSGGDHRLPVDFPATVRERHLEAPPGPCREQAVRSSIRIRVVRFC